MDVSERIEQLMHQRNWSVYRLGKESGLAQSTLSHVFRKDSEPTLSTLETICKAFGITLGEFFSDGEFVPLTESRGTYWTGGAGSRMKKRNLLQT